MIAALLLIFSAGAILAGMLTVSQATMGVWFAAVGCWLAILARIAQARR